MRDLRLNGTVGLDETLKLESWRLQLVGSEGDHASPLYVPDVTAWNYEYAGDIQADQQALDVKSAPGNTLGRDGGNSESGAKSSGEPREQKSSPGGKAGQAGRDAKVAQEPGAGAGSGQPATDGATASRNIATNAPRVNGLPHVDITERFQRMARAESRKRNQGDAEAGPSASSLDIATPGLLLTMNDLMKLPRVEHVFEFHCIEGWSVITQPACGCGT